MLSSNHKAIYKSENSDRSCNCNFVFAKLINKQTHKVIVIIFSWDV